MKDTNSIKPGARGRDIDFISPEYSTISYQDKKQIKEVAINGALLYADPIVGVERMATTKTGIKVIEYVTKEGKPVLEYIMKDGSRLVESGGKMYQKLGDKLFEVKGSIKTIYVDSLSSAKKTIENAAKKGEEGLNKLVDEFNVTFGKGGPKKPIEGGSTVTGPTNKLIGTEWENYVEATKLKGVNVKGMLETQQDYLVKDFATGKSYTVRPDFEIWNANEELASVAAIADAKAGAIVLDAQARGFIQVAANQTASKTLIYYVPKAGAVPQSIYTAAQSQGVKILEIVVK